MSDELDCSDSSEGIDIFKDSSFFFKNLSFFSALFLCLVSSLSLFSSSISCTHQQNLNTETLNQTKTRDFLFLVDAL